jgi:ubiquinone/menaquinone biosynthesis C-methylase UbiE
MDTEREVERHYTLDGLERRILDALVAAGKDIDRLTPEDLSAADEFHLGWRAATAELAERLDLGPGMHLLDVGSGIGGPARHFAQARGCRVTGIDLTEAFVAVATALTRRCGLEESVSFRQASALDLPFEAGAFDAATLIHVGMNIPDKARAFAEVRRVLAPGARFGVYEVVRTGAAALTYPMPWAATPETSFVETADAYRRLLAEAGFEIEGERDRSEFVTGLGRAMREDVARNGVPPLGLHVLMGPASRERFGNVMAALERGDVAPVEFIARAA